MNVTIFNTVRVLVNSTTNNSTIINNNSDNNALIYSAVAVSCLFGLCLGAGIGWCCVGACRAISNNMQQIQSQKQIKK